MTEATSVDERYTTATNTSNLRVTAEKRSDADILIAAGWSPSRIGMTLLRLHTRITNGGLKDAHTQLTIYAYRIKVGQPEAASSAVLAWWLNKVCPVCHGVKFQVISGTPSLSTKFCPKCHGTGEARLPHGDDGRRIANYIDDCLYRSRKSLKSRLHSEKAAL